MVASETAESQKEILDNIQVEKDVPIPQIRGRVRAIKYPFAKMSVNDSFFAPCKADETKRLQSKISAAAWNWVKREGNTETKFLTRQRDKGVRCWRVK